MRTLGGVSCHVVEKFKCEVIKRKIRSSSAGRRIEKKWGSWNAKLAASGAQRKSDITVVGHLLDSLAIHKVRQIRDVSEWVSSISHTQTVLRGISDAVAFSF